MCLGIMISSKDLLGRLDDYPTRSGYVISPFVFWVGGEQMDEKQIEYAVNSMIEELDDSSIKEMGSVMAMLRKRYAGKMDFSKASMLDPQITDRR